MRSGQKMPPMENYSQKRICEYNKEDHNSWIANFGLILIAMEIFFSSMFCNAVLEK
jgi:hypothetical protein